MGKFVAIKSNTEFRTLYYRGKSRVHPGLVTYARRNRYGVPRIGITTGKKIGKAVQRNRCRRIIREACRTLSPALTGGWDIVFVARGRTVGLTSTAVRQIMTEQLTALGVLSA